MSNLSEMHNQLPEKKRSARDRKNRSSLHELRHFRIHWNILWWSRRRNQKIRIQMNCSYCNQEAEKVTGEAIYPHRPDLYDKSFFQCKPCDAYVGTHQNSGKSLGRLANAELREKKKRAHAVFDPIWRSKERTRSQAYKWLGREMGLTRSQCHIGMFDEKQCDHVVHICERYAKPWRDLRKRNERRTKKRNQVWQTTSMEKLQWNHSRLNEHQEHGRQWS